jgi:hypothetical protein
MDALSLILSLIWREDSISHIVAIALIPKAGPTKENEKSNPLILRTRY